VTDLAQDLNDAQKVTDHYPDKRVNTMSDSLTDLMLCDEETLSQELPDAALEVAAGKYGKSEISLPLRSAQDWIPAPPEPH